MTTQKHTKVSTTIGLGIIILVLIAISGFFLTRFVVEEMKLDETSNLLMRANMIALMIDKDRVAELEGNENDLKKESYLALKQMLRNLRVLNDDSRFIYIMGLNDQNQQFFYVDSEDFGSPDYSAPGDLYLDATDYDINNYRYGVAYADGPYTDSWGEWFSAYSPILDQNKKVLGMIGIDLSAERVLLRISIVEKALIMIFSLLFYITLLLVLRTQRLLR